MDYVHINKQFSLTGLHVEYLTNPVGISRQDIRFGWKTISEKKCMEQAAYQIIVSSSLEKINKSDGDMWDTGMVMSCSQCQIYYEGKPLMSGQRYWWKVRIRDKGNNVSPYSEPAYFEMGLLSNDWRAKWIGAGEFPCAPLFRKEARINGHIKKARVYICGLGYYELYINGKKVGDHVLDPGWTDYEDRRIENLLYPFEDNTIKKEMYVIYDAADLLSKGMNVIGIMLGNGWYNQTDRVVEGKMNYGLPKLLFQMDVEYDDGKHDCMVSDETWKVSSGPLIHNNIYYGEVYDAWLEKDGWNEVGYDDSGWNHAVLREGNTGHLKGQIYTYDTIDRTIRPQNVNSAASDRHIYDFGQNFAGWVRISVIGKSGDKVELRFAEELKPDGELDFKSAGGANQIQRDVYILKGVGEEVYEPRFTWHGFRYVEVKGTPKVSCIEGIFVHTSVNRAGSFTCSNEMFNRIQQNYIWTQLSNLHGGVPGDCPHRERLGYTGDGQVTAESAIYNFDMAPFYTKWIEDIGNAQNKKTGFVPHTAPFAGGGGGPAWGSAYIIIPWYMYLYYEDKDVLKTHYSSMKLFMGYLSTRAENGIIIKEEPGGWCLGDWCVPGKIELDERLVNTCFYIWNARSMGKIAGVLGYTNDSAYYQKLEQELIYKFNDAFLNREKGYYSNGIQGADVFPLALDIVPVGYKEKVMMHLIQNIVEKNNGHLDTGIFGTPLLLKVLVENGFDDIAYFLLDNRTYPGYGYMISRGATTLWENWEKENGTHNHPMFGSISAWFYKYAAGIQADPEGPGFGHIIIKPCFIKSLNKVCAWMETMYGRVEVKWKKDGEYFKINVSIPPNAIADIYMPECCIINDEDNRYAMLNCTQRIQRKDKKNVYTVGSGAYEFKTALICR